MAVTEQSLRPHGPGDQATLSRAGLCPASLISDAEEKIDGCPGAGGWDQNDSPPHTTQPLPATEMGSEGQGTDCWVVFWLNRAELT